MPMPSSLECVVKVFLAKRKVVMVGIGKNLGAVAITPGPNNLVILPGDHRRPITDTLHLAVTKIQGTHFSRFYAILKYSGTDQVVAAVKGKAKAPGKTRSIRAAARITITITNQPPTGPGVRENIPIDVVDANAVGDATEDPNDP